MSQQNHNQPSGDSQENTGRSNELRDRKRYEGFEGMNYEQKRKPYREGNELEKDRNANPGSETNMGRRRDDL